MATTGVDDEEEEEEEQPLRRQGVTGAWARPLTVVEGTAGGRCGSRDEGCRDEAAPSTLMMAPSSASAMAMAMAMATATAMARARAMATARERERETATARSSWKYEDCL